MGIVEFTIPPRWWNYSIFRGILIYFLSSPTESMSWVEFYRVVNIFRNHFIKSSVLIAAWCNRSKVLIESLIRYVALLRKIVALICFHIFYNVIISPYSQVLMQS